MEEDLSFHLFNWMCLAVRLDSLSRGKSEGLNIFDKDLLYEKIVKDKISFAEWPKEILRSVEKTPKK